MTMKREESCAYIQFKHTGPKGRLDVPTEQTICTRDRSTENRFSSYPGTFPWYLNAKTQHHRCRVGSSNQLTHGFSLERLIITNLVLLNPMATASTRIAIVDGEKVGA